MFVCCFLVVALGRNAVHGCHVQDGEGVAVYSMASPMSRIPVADEVTLIPRSV